MLPAEALELLACPRCTGPLSAGLSCAPCRRRYEAPDGIPDLRIASEGRTEAVRAFYMAAPFPGYPPHDSLWALRARAGRSDFARALDEAIPGDARVLELGCGTGQMSLFLASADRLVLGADLTRASLVLAVRHARSFQVNAHFVETDLRRPGVRPGAFDVVIASGVLHHTEDPRASFAAMARLARPGGVVVLGLYHAFARLPHRLRRAIARATGYRFIPFDPVLRDRGAEPDRRAAWLRDQYQHVEEHRHTLSEVRGWFRENGVDYLRAFPGTLLDEEPPRGGALFTAAADDWPLENLLAQCRWAAALGREGGLFVTVGRKRA
jgi:SAM-dependent methyltransferase